MVYGILAVVIFIVVLWVRETAKAAKDPDVIEASELRIPIYRYRKYKEAWDKILVIYEKYGTDSQKSVKLVSEIVSGLPNMNEWRRYGDAQLKKSMKSFHEIQNEFEEYIHENENPKASKYNISDEVYINVDDTKVKGVITHIDKTLEPFAYIVKFEKEFSRFNLPFRYEYTFTENELEAINRGEITGSFVKFFCKRRPLNDKL